MDLDDDCSLTLDFSMGQAYDWITASKAAPAPASKEHPSNSAASAAASSDDIWSTATASLPIEGATDALTCTASSAASTVAVPVHARAHKRTGTLGTTFRATGRSALSKKSLKGTANKLRSTTSTDLSCSDMLDAPETIPEGQAANVDESRPKSKGKGKGTGVILPLFPSALMGIAEQAGIESVKGFEKTGQANSANDKLSTAAPAARAPNARLKRGSRAASSASAAAAATAASAARVPDGAATAAGAAAAAAHAARVAATARAARTSSCPSPSPGSSPRGTPPTTQPVSPSADISSSLSTPHSHASPHAVLHPSATAELSMRTMNEGHALASLLYAQARNPPLPGGISPNGSTPDGSDLELSSPEAVASSDHHRRAHAHFLEMHARNSRCKRNSSHAEQCSPKAELNFSESAANSTAAAQHSEQHSLQTPSVLDGAAPFGSSIYPASRSTLNSSESSKPADQNRPASTASVRSSSVTFRPKSESLQSGTNIVNHSSPGEDASICTAENQEEFGSMTAADALKNCNREPSLAQDLDEHEPASAARPTSAYQMSEGSTDKTGPSRPERADKSQSLQALSNRARESMRNIRSRTSGGGRSGSGRSLDAGNSGSDVHDEHASRAPDATSRDTRPAAEVEESMDVDLQAALRKQLHRLQGLEDDDTATLPSLPPPQAPPKPQTIASPAVAAVAQPDLPDSGEILPKWDISNHAEIEKHQADAAVLIHQLWESLDKNSACSPSPAPTAGSKASPTMSSPRSMHSVKGGFGYPQGFDGPMSNGGNSSLSPSQPYGAHAYAKAPQPRSYDQNISPQNQHPQHPQQQQAAGELHRRNSARSKQGSGSAIGVLDAILNASNTASPHHASPGHSRTSERNINSMLHNSRNFPEDDVMMSQDIFQSFQSTHSYASARPPLSGGGGANPSAPGARRKRSKSKNKDTMMSTMASGMTSFDGMDTMMTMASLPGGERVAVRRASPSIAIEREEYEKMSPKTSEKAPKDGNSGGSGGDSSDVVAGKTKTASSGSWKGFKITGFICCFTGWGQDGHLHGENMAPLNADMYGSAQDQDGVRIVPVDTTPNGLPGNKNPRQSRRADRFSTEKLRDQIRGEMYDPEKEAHVLMSCF